MRKALCTVLTAAVLSLVIPLLAQEAPQQAEVEPASIPWSQKTVIPVRTRDFEKMADFFERNLNIKDIFRTVTPADLPLVGMRLNSLEKDITEYGGAQGGSGVLVRSITENSPAAKAGFETEDIITAVDKTFLTGKKGETLKQLQGLLGKLSIGQKVTFSFLRNGKARKTELAVARRETVPMETPEHPEMFFDTAQQFSTLESVLRKEGRFDSVLRTASQIAGAAYLAMNKTKVAGEELANPFRLREVTYCLRNPFNTILVSQQAADRLFAHFDRTNQDIPGLVRECAMLMDLEMKKVERYRYSDFMPSHIIDGFAAAASHLDSAFEPIGPDGRARLGELLFSVLGSSEEEENSEKAREEQAEMLALAAQLDYRSLAEAALSVVDRINPYNLGCMARGLQTMAPVTAHSGIDGEVLLYEETDYGLVIVGGKGRNIYHKPAAVIIDLGGDDSYIDGAAVATPEHPFAVIVDYGGNDTYLGRGSGPCSATCGIAMLVDLEGNDIYSGNGMCEGWASAGVAILADFGGDDLYRADSACQGGAIFGIGLLLDTQPGQEGQGEEKDSEGNDCYVANSLSQGVGYPGGIGVCIDTAGNDTYRACCKYPDARAPERSCLSLSQGFGYGMRPWEGSPGADGGIGALIDLEGHDFYVGDYFSQGSSYWYALGILYDRKGDDVYLSGRYSQGAGIHLSAASLIDWAGNDRYSAYYGVSQGTGHDWAVGYLFDAAGDDSYSSGVLAQGAGNYVSIGVLADVAGSDFYKADSQAQGYGTVLETRNAGSLGVLLDGAGRDTYFPHKDNETARVSSKYGVVIDKPLESDSGR